MQKSELEVIASKEYRFSELTRMLLTLDNFNLVFPYDLNKQDQIKYAKLGLYYLYRDINNVTEAYKNDD